MQKLKIFEDTKQNNHAITKPCIVIIKSLEIMN